jgi:hypothetical protein
MDIRPIGLMMTDLPDARIVAPNFLYDKLLIYRVRCIPCLH